MYILNDIHSGVISQSLELCHAQTLTNIAERPAIEAGTIVKVAIEATWKEYHTSLHLPLEPVTLIVAETSPG